MDLFQSIIISVVEGLTEFLPVSSTGHMIITEKLLRVEEDDFVKLFTVAVQLGAILAVVVTYRKKFFDFTRLAFYGKLIIGVMPALILGFLLSKKIDLLLDSALTVAAALLVGGIILLFVDNIFRERDKAVEKQVKFHNAFFIGCWQCLALIPGVSRSAASIIGGMQQGLTKKEAAEFSFFLAVPTMLAATGYKLLKYLQAESSFSSEQIKLLAVGNIVAFFVALAAIKFFIEFVKRYGFRIWGIYRILLGILLLYLISRGIIE